MKVYTVHSNGVLLRNLLVASAFGSVFLVPLVRAERWGTVAIWSVLLVGIPLFSVARDVRKIRVRDDGIITFVRFLGSRDVMARDIYGLTGVLKIDEYKGREWFMRVRFHGDREMVSFFDQTWEFIDDVRALNPKIEVNGEWPIPYPGFRDPVEAHSDVSG